MEPVEKKSVKDFIKENKKAIIVGGGLAIAGLISGAVIWKKGFDKGVEIAAIVSFEETIKWFDKEFPGKDLMKLWADWMEVNPEKVVRITFF